jgi:hypothetical protein
MKTEEREKAFRTNKQKQASRKNRAKSRGSAILEGKKRVSRNARRHGLFANAVVLGNKRKEELAIVIKPYRKHLNPNYALKDGLTADLAPDVWRLRPPAADRQAASFISSAHTPCLKLALQQQPLIPGFPESFSQPAAGPPGSTLKTEGTNPGGALLPSPVSTTASVAYEARKANRRQKYLLSMYQKPGKNTLKNTGIGTKFAEKITRLPTAVPRSASAATVCRPSTAPGHTYRQPCQTPD